MSSHTVFTSYRNCIDLQCIWLRSNIGTHTPNRLQFGRAHVWLANSTASAARIYMFRCCPLGCQRVRSVRCALVARKIGPHTRSLNQSDTHFPRQALPDFRNCTSSSPHTPVHPLGMGSTRSNANGLLARCSFRCINFDHVYRASAIYNVFTHTRNMH